ncbi:outer mitochondrial membrane transport complex protein-domain-containing protein [Jimgerdemannia flammicorona]|uniref:Outer mitochondrial membrane transport complex protein-domain-containing protein n=1 Tax=Jimgerdemannia flammicorona TaxID=994334 RepID=A0A433Q188_9FUNG|nr:outer mitochondrial membrane transport complex protein-domain-containing protein [Jimgerdemannia flammicorona]
MLQLYVWSPALDAPSIDPGSTAIMAYLQLIGASFNVVESNDPNISPTGELPLLKDGPAWIGGANRILVHLAKKGMDGNENLTPEQKAQYFARKCNPTVLNHKYTHTYTALHMVRGHHQLRQDNSADLRQAPALPDAVYRPKPAAQGRKIQARGVWRRGHRRRRRREPSYRGEEVLTRDMA